MTSSSGPLHGLRVLDISGAVGAYVGRLFADLGAEVIRVPHPLDDVQDWPQHRRLFLEAGKFTNDIQPGSAAWQAVLDGSDILITTGGPSDLRAWLLDPRTTRAGRPSLVHTNISGYGLDGPLAERPHSDLTRLAAGGLLYLGGDRDREPVRPYPEQSSVAVSLHAAVATLIAVRRRDKTGKGDFIDVSAQEAVAHSLENAVQYVDLEDKVRARAGAGPVEGGTGLFRCADGWVYLVTSIGGKKLRWDELVQWLIEEDAAEAETLTSEEWTDPAYVRSPEAVARFRSILERFMQNRSKRDLYEGGQKRSISIAPVSSAQDLLDNPQLHALEFFTTHIEDGQEFPFPGSPYRFSRSWVGPRTLERQGQ
jgi:benzylsuccinate CoA-transferase BbsE subunit